MAIVEFDFEDGRAETQRGRHFASAVRPTKPARRSGISSTTAAVRPGALKDTRTRQPAKKILRKVFTDGDAWFRTGDLMRKEESGFFYFIDRVGDTYRWKGENVSTIEVAATVSARRAA